MSMIRRAYEGRPMPAEQLELFRHSDRVFPTRTVRRGARVRELRRSPLSLADLRIVSPGQPYDLFDYLFPNRVASLMVVKSGQVCFEHHELGNGPATCWVSMSMAKSLSSALVGVAIQDGLIRSADDRIEKYVPELAGSGYDG